MFNWLRAAGWEVKDAYKAFEHYNGKVSYQQLGLQPPTPMEKDEHCTDGWSHMSDYDDFGKSPTEDDDVNGNEGVSVDPDKGHDNKVSQQHCIWQSQEQSYKNTQVECQHS